MVWLSWFGEFLGAPQIDSQRVSMFAFEVATCSMFANAFVLTSAS